MSVSYFSNPANGGDGSFIRKTSNGVIFDTTPDEVSFSGDYDDVYYYDGTSVVDRPTMPLTGTHGPDPIVSFTELYMGVNDVLFIENIPVGAIFSHPAGDIQVDDGFITWSTPIIGEYDMKFSLFPFNDVNFKVFT